MNANLQNRISPTVAPNTRDISQAAMAQSPTDPKGNDPKADFKSLLLGSNAEISRERAAKNPKDLASAKTPDDFFKMLNERANPNQNTPKNKLEKDDFLKLFIAQLRNQDPLKPDDATQMASQMAQFNSLEQMMNVNKTLEQMVKGQNSSRAVGMLDYVNKDVTVDGGKLRIASGKLSNASFVLDKPAAQAELEVRDSSGTVIAKKAMGILEPGEHKLMWDGTSDSGKRVNDGVYSFAVVATGNDGLPIDIGIKSKVKITGVDLKEDGGGFYSEIGPLKLSEISAVGLPGFVDRAKVKADEAKSESKVDDGSLPVIPLNEVTRNPAFPQNVLEADKPLVEGAQPSGKPAVDLSKIPIENAASEKRVGSPIVPEGFASTPGVKQIPIPQPTDAKPPETAI